jgi:hypothetical protein
MLLPACLFLFLASPAAAASPRPYILHRAAEAEWRIAFYKEKLKVGTLTHTVTICIMDVILPTKIIIGP